MPGHPVDLVAFDPDDSSVIIVELKRDKNKLQLLQALSYAAMAHQWGTEDLIEKAQRLSSMSDEEIEKAALSDPTIRP